MTTNETLTLQRLAQTDAGTFGQLLDAEHRELAVTLERPWVDADHDGISDRNVSCIPAGTYTAHRYRSPKRGYDVFMLSGVPGRSDIELHIGNVVRESSGCILLGSNVGIVNGQHGITGSTAAFRRFMERMAGVETFTLVVVNPTPTVLAA